MFFLDLDSLSNFNRKTFHEKKRLPNDGDDNVMSVVVRMMVVWCCHSVSLVCNTIYMEFGRCCCWKWKVDAVKGVKKW